MKVPKAPESGPRRRRPRIARIVIIAVALAAIAEPLVMYRILSLEKQRRQAVELPAAVRSPSSGATVQ